MNILPSYNCCKVQSFLKAYSDSVHGGEESVCVKTQIVTLFERRAKEDYYYSEPYMQCQEDMQRCTKGARR